MWSQTPQFDLQLDSKDDIGIDMNVHHGIIKSLSFKDSRFSMEAQEDLRNALVDQKMQDIRSWASFLQDRLKIWDHTTAAVAERLDVLIPIPELSKP